MKATKEIAMQMGYMMKKIKKSVKSKFLSERILTLSASMQTAEPIANTKYEKME